MSEPIAPTIIYPNGNEYILSNKILLQWENSRKNGNNIIYDIYYTDNYSSILEPEWIQITSVPANLTSFSWTFLNSIKSNKCRIGIRAKNSKGERGDFSVSSNDFSINIKTFTPPVVISPYQNGSYSNFINIVLDYNNTKSNLSQKSYYQAYYSSSKLNFNKVPIILNYPIDKSFVWNISQLPPSDDYELTVIFYDSSENYSLPSIVKNINIYSAGFFLVDTQAPEILIDINNNDVFTKKEEVNINIVAYDKVSGVHSLVLNDQTNFSSPTNFSDVKRFKVSSDNELKYILANFQDFAGNRSSDNLNQIKKLEIMLDSSSDKIVDITLDQSKNEFWLISYGESATLYKFTKFPVSIFSFEEKPTAITYYKDSIYIGIELDNKSSFKVFNFSELKNLYSFSSIDSTINGMISFNDLLFMGMENGDIYSYDGVSLSFVQNITYPIKYFFSDNNSLYLSVKNSLYIYVYNGDSFLEVEI